MNGFLAALAVLFLPSSAHAEPKKGGPMDAKLYEIPLKDISGKAVTLAPYKGKAMLIVNTASRCGYTPQYKDLEALHKKYSSKGLAVLGFPSNDFGAQEPGGEAEIKNFCEINYGVSFPLFSKTPVLGTAKHPLYKWLTENAPAKGEVRWNFEKFLVDRQGNVVSRFRSGVKPGSAEMTKAIEKAL